MSARSIAMSVKARLSEPGRPTFQFTSPARSALLFLLGLAGLVAMFAFAFPAQAHPFPPAWENGNGAAVHFPPVQWPSDNAWIPYTMQQNNIEDNRNQDPSNGGTSPQNYVNISSGCTDLSEPSVYYQYDTAKSTIFFRWRTEQVANTYATGPSAGSYSSGDPWNSALWTVLIDVDGDGFREYAVHLDGSSGSPSTAIDRLAGIYSNTNSQSIDYVNNANIHLLAHNPTAFVDGTNRILNFQNSLTPSPNWWNGSNETVWDYGTTRSTLSQEGNCSEYFIDYQIPLGLLDASAVGGPKVSANTPISFLFATANSLNNPLQKDVVLNGDYVADPTRPAPFGDIITLDGTIPQPIVQSVSANGCGPATLTAQVLDSLNAFRQTSVTSVDFYSYYDANSDGQANDDGETWNPAASASRAGNPVGTWTASWNSSALAQGQHLIGVRAQDAQNNVTWSHLTQEQADGYGAKSFVNPTPAAGIVQARFLNSCGTPPPSASKSANPSQVTAGDTVEFTITVSNPTSSPITVSAIQDTLPPGFAYLSTGAGTLGAATALLTVNAMGSIEWAFSPAVTVPATSSRTLIFTARAPSAVGTYSNVATVTSSKGTLTTDPAQVAVGAPRLTIQTTVDKATANPGDTLVYTIRYANDSPIGVTDAVIVDTLPQGLTSISPNEGGVYDSGAGTITWDVGDIASGEGPFTVSFTAVVQNPYPAAAPIPVVNPATISSPQTTPATSSASTHVNAPRPVLTLQQEADRNQVAPGGQVVFTLRYANTGNATATNSILQDTLPLGWTFVSATNGGTHTNGVVTWNLGDLASNGTGFVQMTLQANNPYNQANPATNPATLDSVETSPVSDSYRVGVTQTGNLCNTYYFKSTTANVGSDGTRNLATTTAPAAGAAGTSTSVTTPLNQVYIEAIRFYQDPPTTSDVLFSGSINTNIYIDRAGGPGITIRGTVYNYNPTTGARTSLGTSTTSFNGNKTGLFTFTVPASGTLSKGNRLLWVFEVKGDNNNAQVTLLFQYDGAATNSRADYCVTPPAELVLDKYVSHLFTEAGSTLTYTIPFANVGQSSTTSSQIVETLADGLTFVSAKLNGSDINPAVSGQQLTFNVNPSGQPSGTIPGGGSGTLVVVARVNKPLAANISTLTSEAVLQSAQTLPLNEHATSTVLRPAVTIRKSADQTLLVPGDTVTYTLTVANNGRATATNVTVNDVLPATPYFTYVTGSATLNGSPASPDPVSGGTLNLNVGSVAAGASATVTVRMQVAASGAPDGVTALDNTATVTDDQTSGNRSSEAVTVSISTNPNLRLSLSQNPSVGTVRAGDLVTYTLTVRNDGSSDALNVIVQDPIPARTSYAAGSLRYENNPQTDGPDGDTAHFDATNNRVTYRVGTLPAGETRTMHFTVRVNTPMPNGTTRLDDAATVRASNAAGKEAEVTIDAVAAPAFSLIKSAPTTLPFPLATLAAPASGATTITVDDATRILVNDVVSLNGTTATVTGINGKQLTVSAPLTGAAGAALLPVYEYVLNYTNKGTADATSVVVVDALPAGLTYLSSDSGGTQSGNTVTWNLGTLSVGESGTLRVQVRPDGPGTYTNAATIDSTETAPAPSNTTVTRVGVLELTQVTTTPNVTNGDSGTQATYVITVTNQLDTPATGVVVTDTLAPGFTYKSLVGFGGDATRTSDQNPSAGSSQPSWGTWTLPANGTLTITYVAAIAPTVGPATYQNDVRTTSTSLASLPFDSLSTTGEDVTVAVLPPPLGVQLAGFTATAQEGRVLLAWETGSEESVVGFNLYRGTDPDAEGTLLTDELIASEAPGSSEGYSYNWIDISIESGVTYYYWLEAIETSGETTRHGPVSATYYAPTAVTLERLEAARPASLWPHLAVTLLTLIGGGLFIGRRTPAEPGRKGSVAHWK